MQITCKKKLSLKQQKVSLFLKHLLCCCSVAKLCSTLLDLMDCSMPGLPVPHQLPEVHAIESVMHPTISSSVTLFSFYLQSFTASVSFQWVSCSHQVTKILELHLQYQSFQWVFRLISFKIDWFNLLALQGTLKTLL